MKIKNDRKRQKKWEELGVVACWRQTETNERQNGQTHIFFKLVYFSLFVWVCPSSF
jgi:hypothetical protein